MHVTARQWVALHARPARSVLDIGGRDINGSVRDLFPGAKSYVSIDLLAGPAVDVVGDVTLWDWDETFEVVVCCEVLEHAENWRDILRAAHGKLEAGGLFILTCAGPGRAPHSGTDGGHLRPEEYYSNITEKDLFAELLERGFVDITTSVSGEDLRAVAQKRDA